MEHSQPDRLFVLGGRFIAIVHALIGAFLAALLIAIPLIAVYPDFWIDALDLHFSEPGSTFPTGTIMVLIAMSAVIVLLAWFFVRELRRIIESASASDPFIPENADRLTRMAWLMLAMQLLRYPAAMLGLEVERAFKGPTSEVEVSGLIVALLTVITLFMLARIFRRGSEMREEMAATI